MVILNSLTHERVFYLSDIDLYFIEKTYNPDKIKWPPYRRLVFIISPAYQYKDNTMRINEDYTHAILLYLVSMNMGISKNIALVDYEIISEEVTDNFDSLGVKVTIKW